MCFFLGLIPATFLLTIGYFVLFASSKAQEGIKTFGLILAIWIFVIALFPPIVGAYVTLSGQCRAQQMMKGFGRGLLEDGILHASAVRHIGIEAAK